MANHATSIFSRGISNTSNEPTLDAAYAPTYCPLGTGYGP